MSEDEDTRLRIERRLSELRRLSSGAARAKRSLGLRGSHMNRQFFEDIWPKVLEHLRRTGFVLGE